MPFPSPDTTPGDTVFPSITGDNGEAVTNVASSWLNPHDPAVRSAVVSGVWGKAPHSPNGHPVQVEPEEIDIITAALQVASAILTPLTAYRIHSAGVAVEDFQATRRAHRLSLNYAPVRHVLSVERVTMDAIEDITEAWQQQGNNIRFENAARGYYGMGPRGLFCGEMQETDRLRVTYQFGSTITASARRAVLWLAHQFWLEAAGCDDCGECQLPGRTTSVQREGLQFTLLDPQDYLREGKTGVPSVDLWISSVNPKRAIRPAGVYSPESPPAENISISTVRPVWSQ
jgi:hypothetical protein